MHLSFQKKIVFKKTKKKNKNWQARGKNIQTRELLWLNNFFEITLLFCWTKCYKHIHNLMCTYMCLHKNLVLKKETKIKNKNWQARGKNIQTRELLWLNTFFGITLLFCWTKHYKHIHNLMCTYMCVHIYIYINKSELDVHTVGWKILQGSRFCKTILPAIMCVHECVRASVCVCVCMWVIVQRLRRK